MIRVVGHACDPDRGGAGRADDWPRDRQLRLVPGVVGHLLQGDQRAEERDEERSAHGQALALRLEHVTHLVHEEQEDEPDPEPPAAEPDVERGRDEHRAQELRLEEDASELDRRARRPRAAARPASAGAGSAARAARAPAARSTPVRRAWRALRGSARSYDSWYPGPSLQASRRKCAEIHSDPSIGAPSLYLRRPARSQPTEEVSWCEKLEHSLSSRAWCSRSRRLRRRPPAERRNARSPRSPRTREP